MNKRNIYLNKIISFKDTEFIKVITGLRRSGKSSLMLMYIDYLIENKVNKENIIYINFESGINDFIKTYNDLYNEIKDKIKNGRYYVFLDEVQNIDLWQKAVNAINIDFDVDVYITGSNAYLLSSELSTLIAGRYVEIKMYPLCFKEYIEFLDFETNEVAFESYLKYGGMPAISKISDNEDIIVTYLNDIYNSIVKKDIIERNKIKDVLLLEKIIKFIFSNIGSKISTSKISGYLNSNKIVGKCNPETIESYLSILENSFIIYRSNRFDVKSKEVLKTLSKYYVTDIGIKNALLGFRNIDEGHVLENIVYFELLVRGYKVSIGKINDLEVDFIAENINELKYIQVTQSLTDPEVFNRELKSLEIINDNYEKIIITKDKTINKTIKGVKIINIIDFLLENN